MPNSIMHKLHKGVLISVGLIGILAGYTCFAATAAPATEATNAPCGSLLKDLKDSVCDAAEVKQKTLKYSCIGDLGQSTIQCTCSTVNEHPKCEPVAPSK